MKIKPNHFHSRGNTTELKTISNRKYTVRSTRLRYFYPDEWVSFFDNLKENQKTTFKFLINTGGRIQENRRVTVGDVDFDRCSIAFRWTKTRTKDGQRKVRIVPISPQFAKELKKIVKQNNLKNTDSFGILSTSAANTAMKKALEKANIPDWKMFSVHNVRKTLETWLISLDVDSLKIVAHFGHTMSIAAKHYVSPETFSTEDKRTMRQIIGDLYLRHSF